MDSIVLQAFKEGPRPLIILSPPKFMPPSPGGAPWGSSPPSMDSSPPPEPPRPLVPTPAPAALAPTQIVSLGSSPAPLAWGGSSHQLFLLPPPRSPAGTAAPCSLHTWYGDLQVPSLATLFLLFCSKYTFQGYFPFGLSEEGHLRQEATPKCAPLGPDLL